MTNSAPVKVRKKLIEVALPLEAINKAAAREKSIRHGNPSTLHLWWARRPLAAARAVIFAQVVDDPSANPDLFPTEKTQEKERRRLFKIIEELVQWENTTNEAVLARAREEILESWRHTCADNAGHPRAKELFDQHKLPALHDPFSGGGAIPLEAQRLGLEAFASDLNPVAVLICKAMIEIPPKFAGKPPINPESRDKIGTDSGSWEGAKGLAQDVRYYGKWMRDEAERRIGHLYPHVEVTKEMPKARPDLKSLVGEKLTVIAWLWVRTVKSPNPAFRNVDVPLASTFLLGTKPGKEASVEPLIENGNYRFTIRVGKPKNTSIAKFGTAAGKRGGFNCLMSGVPITYDYIRSEGQAGRMSSRLMAIVTEGPKGRVYFAPSAEHETAARSVRAKWKPEVKLHGKCRVNVSNYGMDTFGDLYTERQLVALNTFSDLVAEATVKVRQDALAAGMSSTETHLADGGKGATAYSEALATYLGIAVSRYSNASTSVCSWNPGEKKEDIRFTFSRQAIPMTWDYAEGNPFSSSSGNYSDNIETWLYKSLSYLPSKPKQGVAFQADAATQVSSKDCVVSTDPPYYDNIGYADLSDFFYVWLRRALRSTFPELTATVAVPKAEELVATPYRHGSKEKAEEFFLKGMTSAMNRLAVQSHLAFPVTIYYAFKQSETETGEGTASTGWETFLEAVIRAGFRLSGTWPMRTERSGRSIGIGANALASSIILVCHPKLEGAPTATRRDFLSALQRELPEALRHLQAGNIAPVDLAQAAIGPGMAVFTRYSKVLDAQGRPLSVRDALALINQTLDAALAEQEGDFDADSRWALTWFEQYAFDDNEFGEADNLARAKNTSVTGIVDAGIGRSKGGKVRLLKPSELSDDWDPLTDLRVTHWEMVHQLIRALESDGESAAAGIVTKLGLKAEPARELCYRLYTVSERKKRAAEALSYNALVQSWPEIMRLAKERTAAVPVQQELV